MGFRVYNVTFCVIFCVTVGDLNLPDNLLSGIDGFQGGGGASVNDDPYNLSARTAPNADVVAIIAAAAATADIEVATSESTYRKRKAAALLRENAAAAATAKNLNGQIYSSGVLRVILLHF